MGFLPRIWGNDGTIFAQVGKYFKMLFPILGNARDKKSPPWERLKLGLSFPDAVFSLGKYVIYIPRSQNWETNGFISQNMGK